MSKFWRRLCCKRQVGGEQTEEAIEMERRWAAVTWLKQNDALTRQWILWLERAPEEDRLAIAEVIEEVRVTRLQEREQAVKLITQKNRFRHETELLEGHLESGRGRRGEPLCEEAVAALRRELEEVNRGFKDIDQRTEEMKRAMSAREREIQVRYTNLMARYGLPPYEPGQHKPPRS